MDLASAGIRIASVARQSQIEESQHAGAGQQEEESRQRAFSAHAADLDAPGDPNEEIDYGNKQKKEKPAGHARGSQEWNNLDDRNPTPQTSFGAGFSTDQHR